VLRTTTRNPSGLEAKMGDSGRRWQKKTTAWKPKPVKMEGSKTNQRFVFECPHKTKKGRTSHDIRQDAQWTKKNTRWMVFAHEIKATKHTARRTSVHGMTTRTPSGQDAKMDRNGQTESQDNE
jgi:hypothetical protein